MGARLYLPTVGRFTSVDPIEGGVDNNYVYPTDGVNEFDLSGQFTLTTRWKVGIGIGASVVAVGAVCYFSAGIGCAAAVARGASWMGRAVMPKSLIKVSVKKSGPNHWWPNARGVGGKGWCKHIEINVKVINRASGKVVKFIHKQIKYGRPYKLKHGKGGRF